MTFRKFFTATLGIGLGIAVLTAAFYIKGGLQTEFDDLDDEYLEEYPVDDLYDEDEDFDLEDDLEDNFYDHDWERFDEFGNRV